MKNFYQSLIILTFFSACSNEGDLSIDDTDATHSTYHSKSPEIPANTDNDYDIAGQIHNEILAAYCESTPQPTTLEGVMGLLEAKTTANPNFFFIKELTYTPPFGDRVLHIANLKGDAIDEVINGSGLSTIAKTSFNLFVTSLLRQVATQENYQPIYDFIVGYEAQVKANPVFSSKDKEVILITTSIARHSVYLKKKRPKKNTDPDWDWMTGNIMGGTDGASSGTAEAISMALAVGIFENIK